MTAHHNRILMWYDWQRNGKTLLTFSIFFILQFCVNCSSRSGNNCTNACVILILNDQILNIFEENKISDISNSEEIRTLNESDFSYLISSLIMAGIEHNDSLSGMPTTNKGIPPQTYQLIYRSIRGEYRKNFTYGIDINVQKKYFYPFEQLSEKLSSQVLNDIIKLIIFIK